MKNIKMSLIDNDFAIQAKTDLDVNDNQNRIFLDFIKQISKELVTGQTAYLEIEGLEKYPVTFTIASSM